MKEDQRLNKGDSIFNTKTNTVLSVDSFSDEHQGFYTLKGIPENIGFIKLSELQDWEIVTLENLQKYPIAYCNHITMGLEDLYKTLQRPLRIIY